MKFSEMLEILISAERAGETHVAEAGAPTIVLDNNERAVGVEGQRPVPLRAKSYRMLEVLAAAAPEPVSKDRLMALVWPDRIVSEDSIFQCIRDIRKALGDTAQSALQTIPGLGYRLRARIRGTIVASALPLPDKPSIAVLPFSNISADSSQAYFIDGMVQGITSALSRIKTFFVISGSSALIFKNKYTTYHEVRDKLGVHYFLEGSMQKSERQVRINVQLVETGSGGQIWVGQYDGGLSDIFELQDTIIAQVAGAMHPSIRKAEIDRSLRKHPKDLGAYDFVMRAMPHIWSLDKNDNREALALLNRAIEIDSNYGVALSLAAWCHGQQVTYNWSENLADSRLQAKDLANRAVMLSHDDPLALTALGAAYATIGDQESAQTFLERAVLIDPNSSWAWIRLGWSRTYAEQPADAIQCFKNALRLSPYDPLNFNCHVGLGSAYTMNNEFDQAIKFFELALKENPKAVWMYRRLVPALWMSGRLDDAKEGIRRLQRAYPGLTATKVRNALPFSTEHNAWNCDLLVKAGLPE